MQHWKLKMFLEEKGVIDPDTLAQEIIDFYKAEAALNEKEKSRDRSHKWYMANKERKKQYSKEWAQRNKDKIRESNRRQREKRKLEVFKN